MSTKPVPESLTATKSAAVVPIPTAPQHISKLIQQYGEYALERDPTVLAEEEESLIAERPVQ